MSCCNHDCRQGRDCPKRKTETPPAIMYVVVCVLLTAVILLTWK